MFYSFVIPVFNRPDEIDALLSCLVKQELKNFEVLIIESGSSIKSDEVVERYKDRLDVQYHYKGNDGQGFSRNYGFARATGDYFVVLDSDVVLDADFLKNLNHRLETDWLDAYGGPDRLHPDSTNIQKAVNYSMTSLFTTGGIRGRKNHVGKFYPRSFNMGFSRKVYEATQGFKLPYFGEDIEFSARVMSLGFKTGLVENAYVYHKRKTNFGDFYKQMNFFGRARINTYIMFPDTLKLVHFFPAAFFIYYVLTLLLLIIGTPLASLMLLGLLFYIMAIFIDSTIQNKNPLVGWLSVPAVFVQMTGYGLGFIKDYWTRVVNKKK